MSFHGQAALLPESAEQKIAGTSLLHFSRDGASGAVPVLHASHKRHCDECKVTQNGNVLSQTMCLKPDDLEHLSMVPDSSKKKDMMFVPPKRAEIWNGASAIWGEGANVASKGFFAGFNGRFFFALNTRQMRNFPRGALVPKIPGALLAPSTLHCKPAHPLPPRKKALAAATAAAPVPQAEGRAGCFHVLHTARCRATQVEKCISAV